MENQTEILTIEVEESMKRERLDRYLSNLPGEHSRSFFQKLIRDGAVKVNGETVEKTGATVEAFDVVEVCIPIAQEIAIEAEDIPLDILYEDRDLLVVNKPKGMVVHPAAGHLNGTLVNAVLYHCKGELSGINGEIRPGIVHRIDRDTTGALIVCKNDHTHQLIAEQIAAHSVTRRYVGIVHGNLKEDSGTIDAPIGRSEKDRKKMAVNERNGRRAVTHYKVLARFEKFTYVQFELETGRTHQIRVHMAHIHHPLLGDAVYGPSKCPFPDLIGQTLHAQVIGFIHPTTGEYVEVQAPLPEYFDKLLQKLS